MNSISQEPGGVALSMMRFNLFRYPQEFFFNIPLFLWHLFYLTLTYRIRWHGWPIIWGPLLATTAVFALPAFPIVAGIYFGLILLLPGKMPWRLIIRAASISHIQLCISYDPETDIGIYASQTAPGMLYSRYKSSDFGRHYQYMEPTFAVESQYLLDYANAHYFNTRARKHDYLQLLSFVLNSVLFWWIPGLEGKEIIKLLNFSGGREVCSTLAAAMLRFVFWLQKGTSLQKSYPIRTIKIYAYKDEIYNPVYYQEIFKGRDTSMVSPADYVVEAFFKGAWILPIGWAK